MLFTRRIWCEVWHVWMRAAWEAASPQYLSGNQVLVAAQLHAASDSQYLARGIS